MPNRPRNSLSISAHTWIQESTNLARIYRDYNERSALIEKEMAAGEIDLVLPKVHPQFDNRYTFAYKIEIEEDPSYWVNLFYVEYYGIRSVRGVDRDVWEEQYAEKWR